MMTTSTSKDRRFKRRSSRRPRYGLNSRVWSFGSGSGRSQSGESRISTREKFSVRSRGKHRRGFPGVHTMIYLIVRSVRQPIMHNQLLRVEELAMAETPVLVTHTRLHEFIVDVLMAMKMEPAPAEITAGHMVRTDLRGVDSHGIGMLPRYVEYWRAGYLQLDSEPKGVRDDGAMALFDAGKSLGHYASTLAMRKAIEKAKAYSIGIATVRNSSHFGAAANYSMLALEHDMIGLATTNTPRPAAVPTFGRQAMFGTNPLYL